MTPEQRKELVSIFQPLIDDKSFDVDGWIGRWSSIRTRALGRRTPDEVAQTPEGFEQVKQVLCCIISGAYL